MIVMQRYRDRIAVNDLFMIFPGQKLSENLLSYMVSPHDESTIRSMDNSVAVPIIDTSFASISLPGQFLTKRLSNGNHPGDCYITLSTVGRQ